MANYFDKYDTPASAVTQPTAGNYFDKYDAPATTGLAAVPSPVLKNPYADTGDFMRGLKTAAHQLPQLAGGAVAFGGDVASRASKALGGDGSVGDAIQNYGLGVYKRHEGDTQQLSKPSDSFTNVLKNPRDLGRYLKYNAGYMGGQLLESAAVMGAGALAGSEVPGAGNLAGAAAGLVARPMVERMVLKKAAELVAEKGLAKEAAEAAARTAVKKKLGAEAGAGAAGLALNTGQELGSIYHDQLEQAQSEGRPVTAGDLTRVGGAAVAAGAVDTLADRLNLGAAARGVQVAEGAGKSVLRRRAEAAGKEMLKQGAIGGGTELAQTALERYGAGQPMTGDEAVQDYVDSTAAGVVGGGMTGAGAGLHVQRPAPGSLTDAANVLSQPANGPIARAAQEGVANGAVAAAAQQAPAPAEAPSAQSTRIDPGQAPWADPSTGELANPSPADMIRALADHMVAQHQATGDMRIDPQQIAEAWGVTKSAVERTRKAAATMASDQLAAAERAAMAPPAAPAPEPTPEAGTTASIPFMITQQMRADLRALGYTDAAIAGMTPEQANTTLQAGKPATTETGATTAPQETTHDERAPEPAPAAPAGTGAAAARAADEQPAARGKPEQPAGGAAAAEPVPDSAAAVAGERTAADSQPALTETTQPTEATHDAAQPGAVPQGDRAARGDRGAAGAGGGHGQDAEGSARGQAPGVAGQAPAQEAAAPRAPVPTAAATEPASAVATRAPKAPQGRSSAPPANAVHAAIQRIAAGEHPAQVLAAADDATVRAVGAALGRPFSPKAPRAAMVERLGETPASDRRRKAADALVALGREKSAEAPPLKPAPPPPTRATQSIAARKAESLRVKTPTGEVNGRSHIDHLVADGYTQLTSARAGDKMVHTLAKADGTSEKIHARQLAYAQERLAASDTSDAPSRNATEGQGHQDGSKTRNRSARPEPQPVVQAVDQREGSDVEPEQPVLPQLRGQGNHAAPAVGGELPGVRPGGGKATEPESHTGSNRQQSAVPTRERAVGDETAAGEQPAKERQPDLQGANADAGRVGEGERHGAVDASLSDIHGGDAARGRHSQADKAGATTDLVAAAAAEAAAHPDNGKPEPTPAQVAADNFAKGHLYLHGLDIAIEIPKGGKRRGVDAKGKAWQRKLQHHYGAIRGTQSADGENLDVYLGPHAQDASMPVFVVDQVKPGTQTFDESKVMLGYATAKAARQAYSSNFPKGLKTFGSIHEMSMDEFKGWLKEGDTTRPAGERAAVPSPSSTMSDEDFTTHLSAYAAQYRELAGREAHNPDYFNADLAKEMFPEYSASKAARRDNNEKVAGRASKIAFTAFEQRLKDPANPDEVVTLMAGGTGSGKSALKPEHGIVYDSTMYDPVAAKRNVKMVLDSGRGVEYRYVFTEPDSAFRAAIARGKDGGRYVNLTAFVRTQEGAYKTVQELMREYADDGRVKFYLYDNTDFGQRQIEAVPAFDYNGLREHLHAILDQEHAAGRVSDAEYRAIARSEPAARPQGQAVSDAADAGRGPRADQDRRPEQSEGLVTTPETPPPGGVSASTATHTPLDDFGERLEGARKFLPPSLKETLSNDVIASQPLSKFWPADAYLSIDNPGAAALAYAARAEVPAKPRLKYKVARWVEKVKLLREIMSTAEDRGGLEAFEQKAATLGYGQLLREFFPKARLLAQLPRDTWGRVDRVGEHPDAIRYDAEGKRIASPFSTVTIDGKTQRFDGTGRIGPDEVQRVKDQLAGEGARKPAGLTKADFEIRGYRNRAEVFINRKGDAERRPLKSFTGKDKKTVVAEARAWLGDNVPALEKAWEAVKARDNVSKADTRRPENRPRVGADRRGGKDVTPEMFEQALGFRGVQFGNWVGQGKGAKDRQGMLNEAYDALLDLADLLGIPSKAISLNGSLGLALGARGAGRNNAHFEPSNLVINLTKTKGAGSLAHEWFHALDNYFSRLRGGEVTFRGNQGDYRRENYITYKPEPAWVHRGDLARAAPRTSADLRTVLQQRGLWQEGQTLEQNAEAAGWQRDPTHKQGVRPEVERAFADLVQALNDSPMAARVKKLDKSADGYWHRIIERGARSFENYVISKLALNGQGNDFLANVADWKAWAERGKNMDRYPYLRPEEEAPVVKAFDALFDTVQTREDDTGNVALFSRDPAMREAALGGLPMFRQSNTDSTTVDVPVTPAQKAHTARIEQLATAAMGAWKGDDVPRLRVVDTPEQLPPGARFDVNGSPSNAYKSAAGMYDGRTIWIVASKHTTDQAGIKKLLTTMAHEGVGHYGVDRIVERELGAGAWTKIENAADRLRQNPDKASPAIRAVLAELDKRYAGADRKTYAREFMAVTAERGVKNGLLDRVVTAIRRWLRRALPDLGLSEHELRQLLVASDRYLRVGETQQQRVQSRAALAFSLQSFAEQVRSLLAGGNRRGGMLDMGRVVAVLRMVGLRDLPLRMPPSVLFKVASGKGGARAVLTQRQIAQLPEKLDEPVAVFHSATEKGSYVVLTDMKDAKGSLVIVAIKPDGRDARVDVHVLTSAYGKERPEQLGGKNAVYWDKEKALSLLGSDAALYREVEPGSQRPGQSVLTPEDLRKFRMQERERTLDSPTNDFSQPRQSDTPAFREFFDGSQVVGTDGQPLVLYHGTAEDFSVFGHDRAGGATGHATSPLGHFFTPDRAQAEGYARNASEGRPADERVVDAYLAIRNAYTMSLKQAQAIETPAQARALRERLEREGYDGIRLPEQNAWVAFDSNQIKSASENRGGFDTSTGNIYFSREENDRGEREQPGVPPEPFSHATESMQNMDGAVSTSEDSTLQRLRDWMRGKYEDFVPAMLGAVQRRFLTELMAGHKALRGAKQYDEDVQALNATRQQLLAGAPDADEHPDDMLKHGAAAIADDLRAYTHVKGPGGWLGAKTEQGRVLAGVMHDSTILGIDPSEPYEPLKMQNSRGEWVTWTPALVKQRIAVLKEVMLGRPGDDKRAMMEEIKTLRSLKFREKERTKAYPALVARYEALPAKGKQLFKQVRDWHAQYSEALEAALEARIAALRGDLKKGDPELAEKHLRMLTHKLRAEFEASRVQGIYFPLNRDGDFWVSYTDKAGAQGFQMFESAAAQERFVKDTRRAGGKVVVQGRRSEKGMAKDAPPGTFIAEVIGTLKNSGVADSVQDDIYQLFLRTLPEMSMRKHAIHRKATPGFSDDITRGFAKNAFHGAHQLARLQYAHRLQSTIDQLQENMDAFRANPDAGSLEVSRGDALLAELKKRHQYLMSPTDSQLANMANSIGFLWFLGASPASALVNLTQNVQVTLPVLGAHHGWPKAMRELGRAVRDSMKTGGNIHRTLKDPDELRAYNMLRARGDIDKTRSHDLAGLSEGSLIQTNPVWARVMAGMTWLFHKAEVVNRESAGMAAYRLARQRGDDFTAAVQYASDIINGTHFDYSADNRPRYMQGNTARIALQFKNYSVSMTTLLYRNLYQAFKGETPEVRRMARRTLTGILGMTGLLAGTIGLPIINVMRFAAGAAHAAFGDDDEPWDFDTEFRNWLAEHFGDTAAGWIADGVVSHATGVNIAGRVSLSDMWFRDSDRELEGKDQYYAYMDSLLGPLAGAAKNLFIGSKMIGDGHTLRGIETMLPSFAKNAMKGYRYASQGANSLAGAPIVSDVSGAEAFAQLIGLQPESVAEQYRINSAKKAYGDFIVQRRTSIRNAYAMAVEQRDGAARRAAQDKMVAFNRRWPIAAIRPSDIRASLRGRARARTEENGIHLPRRLQSTLQQMVNPTGQ